MTRRWRLYLVVVVGLLAMGAASVSAQTRVKLATMAPDGSAWHKALMSMGSEWRQLPDGGVSLRVYPGGTAGDEAAVVRKMRVGQLDAGGITIVGLVEIDSAFEALGIPLLFDSYEELAGVLRRMQPYFEERLEEKGFVFLNWAHGGWAHLFSSLEIRSIDDLRGAKIYVSAGDDVRVQWWKDNGFNPRALATTDILTGLQTGMIDTMVSTPLIAMSMQWYKRIPFMHNLPLGPVVGANVMTRRAWNRLSAAQRQGVLASAGRTEGEIFTKISADDEAAVELMSERGLTVVESADETEWRREIAAFAAAMRGEMVPVEAYDRILAARDAVREETDGETSSLIAALGRAAVGLRRGEDLFATIALIAMAVLPITEGVLRFFFGVGIPGVGPFVQHLTLWIGFLGAALAAREGKLLGLATAEFLPERWHRRARVFSGAVAAGVTALLAVAALELVIIERQGGVEIAAGVPVWVAQLVMPIGLTLTALRLAWGASDDWRGRLVATLGLLSGLWLAGHPEAIENMPAWPFLALLVLATAVGGPIFVALGGAAVLLFMVEAVPAAAVPVATYDLSVSPLLPAIPLFTLAGFLLAEGQASQRLLRVFRSFFGWMPGGTAVVCAAVCAFFTTFTGGSGVTILALGVLLFEALRRDGYGERFSLGLLTGSGSLGLLFPPALPLILYGIVAQQPIEELFVGGLLPGLLLVVLVAAWGVREGLRGGAARQRFELSEAARAVWAAKWELALPVVVLISIFSGYSTPVEAAALAAVYALIVQCFVHRDIDVRKGLLGVVTQCVLLVGGVLIILGMAKGLTSWMVDAQIPMRTLEWVQSFIDSKIVFLLCLNVFLLLVGCLMDIFSAIVVVVPLIVPLGLAYGVDPVHLGILFIANLELGYLTPPVGLNLFLASYRFDRPLLSVWRAALPVLAILAVGVLLITYVPWLTTGLVEVWRGE